MWGVVAPFTTRANFENAGGKSSQKIAQKKLEIPYMTFDEFKKRYPSQEIL